jgi:hypothetical protein
MAQEVERHQWLKIETLEKEQRDMFALMAAMVASAGEQGITVTPESLTKNYEIQRFEDPRSLTLTFTAKEHTP